MSLLLIVAKLWKYKLATLPVLALVVAGVVYVIAVKAPTYEASATYIMVNPPAPPTQDQIARDPALGRIDSDNPYLRFSDQSVVVQILTSRLNSDEVRASLARQGADPNYTTAQSAEFGFGTPIVDITGTGTTPAAAMGTANLVARALTQELDRMQQIRKVAKEYRIKAEVVVGADHAMLKASGKLRAMVAVFALGAVLLFMVVSVADAVSSLRAGWSQGRPDDEYVDLVGSVEPLIQRDPPPDPVSDPGGDAGQWLRAQRS
jgi:capsular polysaccharide biosynthesis protein